MWKPDTGPISTMWMIALAASFFCLFGYLSGYIKVSPDYTKSLQAFEWGTSQIASVVGLFICWPTSMWLSLRYGEDPDLRIGAMIISSLPLIFALFILTGFIDLQPKYDIPYIELTE